MCRVVPSKESLLISYDNSVFLEIVRALQYRKLDQSFEAIFKVMFNHRMEKILSSPHKFAKRENGKLYLYPQDPEIEKSHKNHI